MTKRQRIPDYNNSIYNEDHEEGAAVMSYIIRADYYPNGEIVPLGITDCQGNSQYLRTIKKIEEGNENLCYYECVTSKDKKILLSFSNNKWIVESLY